MLFSWFVCYAFDRVQDVIIMKYYVRVYTVLCSTQTFTTVNCRTGGDFYAWKTGGAVVEGNMALFSWSLICLES